MGKAARLEGQRTRAEVRRHPEAAEVARAAQETADTAVDGLEAFLAGHGKRLVNFDASAFSAIRDSYLGAGYAWPAWSYLPGVALAGALADQAGLTERGPGLIDATMPLTAVAAWLPGRIAVRFDPDLLAEVVTTPPRRRTASRAPRAPPGLGSVPGHPASGPWGRGHGLPGAPDGDRPDRGGPQRRRHRNRVVADMEPPRIGRSPPGGRLALDRCRLSRGGPDGPGQPEEGQRIRSRRPRRAGGYSRRPWTSPTPTPSAAWWPCSCICARPTQA